MGDRSNWFDWEEDSGGQITISIDPIVTLMAFLQDQYGLPVEAVPEEMFDFIKIIAIGAEKYAMNNWLEPDGKHTSERDMHASMFRHLAHSSQYANLNYFDDKDRNYAMDESGEDPLLHLACRALMLYTRRQRKIKHKNDENDKDGESK